jgi:aldehyde:ferredoxin oxidoreductase
MILRVNMGSLKVVREALPEEWRLVGGRGLAARIMNREVPPAVDPLSTGNKLIVAVGPLAGTLAPQLGRISIGAKSPLTMGIKESNAGGPAAQKLDKLGVRAIIVEGTPGAGKWYLLRISKDGAELLTADEYRGMKNYQLADALSKHFEGKPAIISIGTAGERGYKAASISLTDIMGDPSRSAGRGGLGAVMGTKGLKAIVIDDRGTSPVHIADKGLFKRTVTEWVDAIKKDVNCGLFSAFGTPFTIASNSYQGTMPGNNYRTGRPERFKMVTGEVMKKNMMERGGRMHACMPGCVVMCSIIYADVGGNRLASAYEYEGVSMLGTNLGLSDHDEIAALKYLCDDLGADIMEIGAAMGVAAESGAMKMGDFESAKKLLTEIERGSELGAAIAGGVVETARKFKVGRVPAFRGQSMPAHDARAVKGMGVTYVTSPMGADHTAGLTYRIPLQKTGQIMNSLRAQVQAATCDTFGYCLNSVPGRQTSIYAFLADLMNARFGLSLTRGDILEIGKQTIRDELKFNEGAEFGRANPRYPDFIRTEALPPTGSVFDVDDEDLDHIWDRLDSYAEPRKVWEIRFPKLPPILFGAGTVQKLGDQARALGMKKALVIADPVMKRLGRIDEIGGILEESGVASAAFAEVEPDPSVELIEKAGRFYRQEGCDGVIALGGGSSIDTAKAVAVRVSHPGELTEYENMVGGKAKIKPPLPPVVCIPTTSGTGSETNQYAIITDRERNLKFTMMSDLMVPRLSIIDPELCRTMPPSVTAETGLDALAHCVEGYAGMNEPYHPYYEALALYGTRLIGRSLRAAFRDGDDIAARTDMCMAAAYGGISFTKGLGLGHAISHVLGANYHIPHGRGCTVGLLCYVRASAKACGTQFSELAWALGGEDGGEDGGRSGLEDILLRLYRDLKLPSRLSDMNIPEGDLKKIAFEISTNVVNLAANPVPLTEGRILELLREFY